METEIIAGSTVVLRLVDLVYLVDSLWVLRFLWIVQTVCPEGSDAGDHPYLILSRDIANQL